MYCLRPSIEVQGNPGSLSQCWHLALKKIENKIARSLTFSFILLDLYLTAKTKPRCQTRQSFTKIHKSSSLKDSQKQTIGSPSVQGPEAGGARMEARDNSLVSASKKAASCPATTMRIFVTLAAPEGARAGAGVRVSSYQVNQTVSNNAPQQYLLHPNN